MVVGSIVIEAFVFVVLTEILPPSPPVAQATATALPPVAEALPIAKPPVAFPERFVPEA